MLFGLDSHLVNIITGTVFMIGLMIGSYFYAKHLAKNEHDKPK